MAQEVHPLPLTRNRRQLVQPEIDGVGAFLRQPEEDIAIVRKVEQRLKLVAGPIYSPTGVTGAISIDEREVLITRVIENLRPLLDHSASSGVGLAVEPLNRFETSLFNTVEQTMELIRAVDHPSLGLLLDTFHMNIEERGIGAAIRLAGDRLFHFHACGNDRGAPGGDNIDWQSIRKTLGDIGYDGAVSIESFTSANQTIATAASIWRPLAHSQDDIAVDGLKFLQDLFGNDSDS
jgi:D-psicose/D-tagatose/L-ribulose 3-epimerase